MGYRNHDCEIKNWRSMSATVTTELFKNEVIDFNCINTDCAEKQNGCSMLKYVSRMVSAHWPQKAISRDAWPLTLTMINHGS